MSAIVCPECSHTADHNVFIQTGSDPSGWRPFVWWFACPSCKHEFGLDDLAVDAGQTGDGK